MKRPARNVEQMLNRMLDDDLDRPEEMALKELLTTDPEAKRSLQRLETVRRLVREALSDDGLPEQLRTRLYTIATPDQEGLEVPLHLLNSSTGYFPEVAGRSTEKKEKKRKAKKPAGKK